jgi:superfamily I DNA and/or RNA helicase
MVSFISDLIYDGRLYPNRNSDYYKVPKQKRDRLFPQAIEIVDTSEIADIRARHETELNSTYYNLSEAMLSVKKVMDLLKEGERLADICIVTPYKAHVEKLKEIFLQHERFFRNREGLYRFVEKNIYTIDSFQGREQRNIIINWVRSNYGLPGAPTKTGFLRDYRRVNVALSRAKTRLILIGDYETLSKSDNQKVRHIFTQMKQFTANKKIVL